MSVDRTFYDLAIKERDYERLLNDRLRAEKQLLLGQLAKDQALVTKLCIEGEALRKLAHHLRRCRWCGELDVSECDEGYALWEAAGLAAGRE